MSESNLDLQICGEIGVIEQGSRSDKNWRDVADLRQIQQVLYVEELAADRGFLHNEASSLIVDAAANGTQHVVPVIGVSFEYEIVGERAEGEQGAAELEDIEMAIDVIESIGQLVHVRPNPVGAAPPELLDVNVKHHDIAVEKRDDLVSNSQARGVLVELEPICLTLIVVPHIPYTPVSMNE